MILSNKGGRTATEEIYTRVKSQVVLEVLTGAASVCRVGAEVYSKGVQIEERRCTLSGDS